MASVVQVQGFVDALPLSAGTLPTVQGFASAGLPNGYAPYTPPVVRRDDEVRHCLKCKRKKKCRAGHHCANFVRCGRILEHGHIYGGDGTVGSGRYCSLFECKGLAGVPVTGSIAKRRLGWQQEPTVPSEPPSVAQPQLPTAAPSAVPPHQHDALELEAGFLDGACLIEVKKVIAMRLCKDAARLTPAELLALKPGCIAYAPACLVVADIFYARKPTVWNVCKWIAISDAVDVHGVGAELKSKVSSFSASCFM